MESPKLDQLFEQYSQERSHSLSKNEFATLLKLMPALLVATSDGIMDSREWTMVDKMTKMMGDELIPDDVENAVEKEQQLMRSFRDEADYIMKSASKWREPIMAALKEVLAEDKRSKEFVNESMWLFAGTSAGLSKEEEDKIDEIAAQLNLN